MAAMTPCKFTFDGEVIVYDGFDLHSTWNGFDNVAVTPAVREQIAEQFKRQAEFYGFAYETTVEDVPVGEDGLVSLANGFATQIIPDDKSDENWDAIVKSRDAAKTICRKWVSRIGYGFHPDTRGKDYFPRMRADEIEEYEADMERLFTLGGDPYRYAVEAMEHIEQVNRPHLGK